MRRNTEQMYAIAKDEYATFGVDTDFVIQQLAKIPLSIHCWQGDDVGGFELPDAELSGGGIQATGNYPGKARNASELRQDMEKALAMIPGTHRINLHAIYAETGNTRVERDNLEPKHFQTWIDWAKTNHLGIDFNPSLFSHPKADSGFTLSSHDNSTREFWINHVKASRRIANHIGQELNSPCVNNIWIPDGFKDIPIDRMAPRERLKQSLDTIFSDNGVFSNMIDAVECKLFGIGSESYVVGSHEFYMGYAIQNNLALCLDMGHFHPTEVVSDKLSSTLLYVNDVLLHVSRGVRWDSDHVVIQNDELFSLAQELVRNQLLDRVHIGLDFFDASINRVAAWVIGVRAMQKALLSALLEPTELLKTYELNEDYTSRLATLESLKSMPTGAVWNHFCEINNKPDENTWLAEVKEYEKAVLSSR